MLEAEETGGEEEENRSGEGYMKKKKQREGSDRMCEREVEGDKVMGRELVVWLGRENFKEGMKGKKEAEWRKYRFTTA